MVDRLQADPTCQLDQEHHGGHQTRGLFNWQGAICATPARMILLNNGLQWSGYRSDATAGLGVSYS